MLDTPHPRCTMGIEPGELHQCKLNQIYVSWGICEKSHNLKLQGVEPRIFCLQVERSATELQPHDDIAPSKGSGLFKRLTGQLLANATTRNLGHLPMSLLLGGHTPQVVAKRHMHGSHFFYRPPHLPTILILGLGSTRCTTMHVLHDLPRFSVLCQLP